MYQHLNCTQGAGQDTLVLLHGWHYASLRLLTLVTGRPSSHIHSTLWSDCFSHAEPVGSVHCCPNCSQCQLNCTDCILHAWNWRSCRKIIHSALSNNTRTSVVHSALQRATVLCTKSADLRYKIKEHLLCVLRVVTAHGPSWAKHAAGVLRLP
jgi:hypothetical protein